MIRDPLPHLAVKSESQAPKFQRGHKLLQELNVAMKIYAQKVTRG